MMVKICVYVLLVVIATIAGSSVGLGGGVIIKPLLDMVSHDSTMVINFYASLAVFIMAIVSIGKQLAHHFIFNKKKLYLIASGAVVGGWLGQLLLQHIAVIVPDSLLKVMQSLLLSIILSAVLVYALMKQRLHTYHIEHSGIVLLVGLGLGTLSVFLGIGGGPINVVAFMLLFSFDIREAAVYSVGVIFFSQLVKLGMLCLPGQHLAISWPLAFAIVVAAVCGGYIGTFINQRLSTRILQVTYNIIIFLLLCMTISNTWRWLM